MTPSVRHIVILPHIILLYVAPKAHQSGGVKKDIIACHVDLKQPCHIYIYEYKFNTF